VAAISIKVEEPVFESQTKTKLGSKDIGPNGPTVRNYVQNFVQKELDNFLHKNPEVADMLHRRIQESERERKAISGIQKLAKQRAKKANCTTGNYATAASTSTAIRKDVKIHRFLLPRETQRADQSPSRAM
jgi:DNA gyrase/topoisomerase IV subunit B